MDNGGVPRLSPSPLITHACIYRYGSEKREGGRGEREGCWEGGGKCGRMKGEGKGGLTSQQVTGGVSNKNPGEY